jgi:hypothetical protein
VTNARDVIVAGVDGALRDDEDRDGLYLRLVLGRYLKRDKWHVTGKIIEESTLADMFSDRPPPDLVDVDVAFLLSLCEERLAAGHQPTHRFVRFLTILEDERAVPLLLRMLRPLLPIANRHDDLLADALVGGLSQFRDRDAVQDLLAAVAEQHGEAGEQVRSLPPLDA